jgi:hypothetical protein
MSRAAAVPGPALPPGASPAQIRAALLPEEQPEFDRQYQRALDIARETLSLNQLHAMLEHWRRIAVMTQADPVVHRQMLRAAEHTLRTGEVPAGSVSWSQLKAELGL